ncbi:hypothetical protein AOT83_01180 [Mycobacteroides sp. H001]|uniref:hypothetical protein n=1 Tax=Mycobacteroides TaxID=670516 RepID=UPI0007123CA3|nr:MULTISPECIES: hypothetical protein [Mycobacteroides]KRQ24208.1 hypothetical protein AOT86_15700 [Mycobacteroides sp. H072]KRQ32224.1 hypothetical protein AOT84_21745 [Mycobacteroides sp. H002]KRQ47783.1 hypothetical protein AOT85_20210 [Mycobacteroides sp. H054]KRQ73307.1 hypothetical protein AOT83_01180 [Mycobacteroides sp. H001]OHU33139.1 hypothetical protein BKG79_21140 [Mycobacteroides chelonae]
MYLDENAVADRLFREAEIREKIAADYGFSSDTMSASEFIDSVVEKLDQHPAEPMQPRSNREVFIAVVKAVGSNSRQWVTFRRNQNDLRDLLGDFEPARAQGAAPASLRALLPGTTGGGDARAILAWAATLADLDERRASYYDGVIELANTLRRRAASRDIELSDEKLMLCVVGHLIDEPPKRWDGPRLGKLAGMRFPLASEFFRNLGWNGFKPDRHVIRLLNRWVPNIVEQQADSVNALVSLTGRETGEVREAMKYSLAGMAISPTSNYSRTDNLIWLLGANAEKKGRESDTRYVKP